MRSAISTPGLCIGSINDHGVEIGDRRRQPAVAD
jgi:hypothetical protein